jgi:cytochrome d ubiquinol oxidase subunit II
MLAEVPIVFMLVGLAAYAVLAGADFGAGFWTLVSRRVAIREHARHAIGPVWEANHVWLVFVLVVCWTAYPVAFGSITSTLAVPLFIAAVGIILRGAAYALRGELDEHARGHRAVENLFAFSSVLTPFALGTVVGAIASGRVPVGNAKGDVWTSWLHPTSILIGVLAVATSAYLAAVYLAADARRLRQQSLELDFRTRALGAGVVAGAIALAGLVVVRFDARPIWDGLTSGAGLAMVVVSAAAGVTTLALVRRSSFGLARVSAALAVAAIIAGWAFAQEPQFLPGLTISEAAAGRSTLLAVVISVAAGAIVLVPSLALLFGLFLRGRLDSGVEGELPPPPSRALRAAQRHLRLPLAFASAVVGVGLMVFTDKGWTHAIGILCLFALAGFTFFAAAGVPERDVLQSSRERLDE